MKNLLKESSDLESDFESGFWNDIFQIWSDNMEKSYPAQMINKTFMEFFCRSISAGKSCKPCLEEEEKNNLKQEKKLKHTDIVSCLFHVWQNMQYLICVVWMLAKWAMDISAWIYVLQRYLW